jgi:threonine/homoserine/homoserine lactone efflux protein
VIGVAMLVGLTLNFVGFDPIQAPYLSAILNGLAAPPLILLMLILSNSAAVGRRRGGMLSDGLVAVTFLVMSLSGIVYLVSPLSG